MKKLISLICLLLCASMFAVTALADETVTLSDVTADGTYEAKLTRTIKFMGEGMLDHYYVQQGSCTDGVYGYFLLESRVDNACALFKLDLNTWEILDVKYNVPVEHGNGMAYNPNTNQFVVAHCKPTTNRLSFLDHDTYEVVGTLDLPFNFLSVGYDAVNDRYVMGHKDGKTWSVLDGEFNEIARHTILDGFCNNQDLDCNENYIYFLEWDTDKLYASNISIYDWDGNYINYIKLKSMNEVESMFHIGDRVILPFYTKAADIYEAEIIRK